LAKVAARVLKLIPPEADLRIRLRRTAHLGHKLRMTGWGRGKGCKLLVVNGLEKKRLQRWLVGNFLKKI